MVASNHAKGKIQPCKKCWEKEDLSGSGPEREGLARPKYGAGLEVVQLCLPCHPYSHPSSRRAQVFWVSRVPVAPGPCLACAKTLREAGVPALEG